jgi:Xaa-Pro aminopeptidase
MNAIPQKDQKDKNWSGRLGHGLGMQLTEWPSLSERDETILQEGMVVILEPIVCFNNEKVLVHEDNFLITLHGPKLISPHFYPILPII